MTQAPSTATRILVLAALLTLIVIAGCAPRLDTRIAAPGSIQTFLAERQQQVLTFAGYSGAGYQDPQAMLAHAARVLDRYDPATTLVNIGATEAGIGAVYELAKQRGFSTIGIVSSLARDGDAVLSPHVDRVFFIPDSHWGGLLPGTDRLSPTSATLVEVSDALVAIGGGAVTRDELLAAHRAGKPVSFIPADMNHQRAIDKAARKGLPAPDDFRGAAHAALAADDRSFDRTLTLQGIRFRVHSPNRGSINRLTITPAGLAIDNRVIEREIDGTVSGAAVADINHDGSPELYVFVNSAGSGSYGSLVAFSANRRKSLSEIFLPPLQQNPAAAQGYLGHDQFAIADDRLVRRFPLYRDGDSNARPSGGQRQVHYRLTPGEAGWLLEVDHVSQW